MGSFKKGSRPTNYRKEKFPLPEIGSDDFIWLRGITAKEADGIRQRKESADEKTASDYEIIALCAVDENGVRLFQDAEEALAELGDLSLETLVGMAEKIGSMSGQGKNREKN